MSQFTYGTLSQALQDWPAKASVEYTDQIDTIISMGESRLIRDLNLELWDTFDTQAVTGGVAIATKPADIVVERELFVIPSTGTDANKRLRLTKRSYAFCSQWWPDGSTAGTPRYYCEYSDTQWQIPFPYAAAYQVVAHYVQRPESIVSAGNTWLGDNYGDLLFAACLMEAEHFIKADDRYADIKSKYHEELLPLARLESRILQRSGEHSPTKPNQAAR